MSNVCVSVTYISIPTWLKIWNLNKWSSWWQFKLIKKRYRIKISTLKSSNKFNKRFGNIRTHCERSSRIRTSVLYRSCWWTKPIQQSWSVTKNCDSRKLLASKPPSIWSKGLLLYLNSSIVWRIAYSLQLYIYIKSVYK